MNNKIVKYLNVIASENIAYKKLAIKRAAEIIDSLDYKITADNYRDLANLKWIGKGIVEKLEAFFKNPNADAKDFTRISELMTITGIGPSTAEKIYTTYKVKTVKELRKKQNQIPLTHMQHLGLEYYEDLHTPISRKETEAITSAIEKMLGRKATICGSYRREKATQSDIDLLFVGNVDFSKLEKSKIFVDTLTTGDRYTILVKYKNLVRQVDLFNCSPGEYPTFLNYLTGSAAHNLMLRRTAKRNGYIMNQYGIMRGAKKIPIKSEKDIYKLLELHYVEPRDR